MTINYMILLWNSDLILETDKEIDCKCNHSHKKRKDSLETRAVFS